MMSSQRNISCVSMPFESDCKKNINNTAQNLSAQTPYKTPSKKAKSNKEENKIFVSPKYCQTPKPETIPLPPQSWIKSEKQSEEKHKILNDIKTILNMSF